MAEARDVVLGEEGEREGDRADVRLQRVGDAVDQVGQLLLLTALVGDLDRRARAGSRVTAPLLDRHVLGLGDAAR